MTSKDIDKYCVLDDKSREITNKIFDKYKLSNRSYTKLIKISRTIADLEGEEKINSMRRTIRKIRVTRFPSTCSSAGWRSRRAASASMTIICCSKKWRKRIFI